MTSQNKNYISIVPLCGFISGLIFQLHIHTATVPFLIISSSLLIAIACLFWLRQSYLSLLRLFFIYSLATCAGYLIASYHQTRWNQKQTALMTKPFTVYGYVSDVVPLSSRPYMAAVHVTIQSLEQHKNSYNYHNCLLLHYMPYTQAPPIGSAALFTAIKPARKIPTGDIGQYVRKNNIIHQLFSKSDMLSYCYSQDKRESSLLSGYKQWACTVRAHFYQRIVAALSPIGKLYVGLMFFGTREAGTDDIRMLFNRWGLAHFLARSGLHIVIFVFLVSFLLRLIPIHNRLKDIFLFIICIVYDALSWSSVSFLRAWLIAILVIMRSMLGRHTSYLHLLCLSCIAILANNPCHLISLDFQLTYALTFTLALLSNLFSKNDTSAPGIKP